MERIRMFRHSLFGGYNKADVKQYIEELDKALNDKETFYQLKVTQLEIDNRDANEKLALLHKQLQDEEKSRTDAQNRLQSLTQQNELLASRLQEQQEKVRLLNERLDQYMDDNAQLSAKIKKYQVKSEKYEQLNGQIGDIVLNAHTYANKVMEDAKKEAAELAMDSIENMSALSSRVTGINQEIGEMGEKVGDYVQQMNQLLSQLTTEIESAASKIRPSHKQNPEDALSSAGEGETPQTEPPMIFTEQEENGAPRRVRLKIKSDDVNSAQFSPIPPENNSHGPFVIS